MNEVLFEATFFFYTANNNFKVIITLQNKTKMVRICQRDPTAFVLIKTKNQEAQG